MPERNNWTVFIIVLLGLGALSLPRTAPDGTPGQSQTRPEVGSASDRNQKVAGSVKHDVKAETLEKVEAALNERETALQKVGEYFGARDLFITNEDLKDLIFTSDPSISDVNDLNNILPQIHRRIAMLGKLEVSNQPTRFVFQPEIDRRISRLYCINTAIITIPDPESSHFAYMFDRQIESIKRAAEQHGFLLDRFWLPWERTLDRSVASSAKMERSRRVPEPGVLLFRRGYKKHLFVAFLVGETPTSGINNDAFARAVEYHVRLCATDPDSDRPLRVVAPVYSGAYPSLEMAIQDCQRRFEGQRILIYNGSALNPDIPTGLRRLLPEADYQAFVIDSDSLNARFAHYASKTLSIPKDRIAFLHEDTSFGMPKEGKATGTNRFTLPMHLSRIRAAYEREPGMRTMQRPGVRGLTRETLELHPEESGNPTDTMADYSAMTSESEELVLANLLIQISRGDYQLIVITMTDARDVMFLNRMIEKYCPNVRTATLLSDAIYSHPDYLHLLHGMLVVSYYPLFTLPSGQTASGPTQQFASASSHGVYAATAKLLEDFQNLEVAKPTQNLNQTMLAPWLGVVSYQGIWPLTILLEPGPNGIAV